MWKHMALSAAVIAFVVVSLLYCISPGELGMVCSVVSYRVSSQISRVFAIGAGNGGKVVDELRRQAATGHPARPARWDQSLNPNPFRPYDRSDPLALWQAVVGWVRGPLPIAAWAAMTGLLCAGTYVRQRRSRFAGEEKRASLLARAVRRMGEPESGIAARGNTRKDEREHRNDSDDGMFHAGGNSLHRVHDAAGEA